MAALVRPGRHRAAPAPRPGVRQFAGHGGGGDPGHGRGARPARDAHAPPRAGPSGPAVRAGGGNRPLLAHLAPVARAQSRDGGLPRLDRGRGRHGCRLTPAPGNALSRGRRSGISDASRRPVMLRNLLSLVLLLIALPATALAQAPRNAPGTLISADPVAGAPETMRSWRIAYWTSDAGGRA